MMGSFRRMLGSRVGAALALAFVALVGFAFAAGDISQQSSGNLFGQSAGTAATVGDSTITTAELQDRVQRVLQMNQREQPDLTLDRLVAEGGVREVLDQLVGGLSLTEFGKAHGMVPGKALVDAEIAQVPAFQDATGKFNQAQFRQVLQNERISEAALRADIMRQIMQRHLLQPAGAAAKAPDAMVQRYATMLLEQRKGTIAAIPSTAFLPEKRPDDAVLAKYYASVGQRFALPEQRRMRYALVDLSHFADSARPSEAEIAQYYQANASRYAATETRSVQQLILISEGAAKSMAASLGAKGSLENAAKSAGLETKAIGPSSKSAMAAATSEAAANAIFAAAPGALVGPVKTGLGWALFKVSAVKAAPARSLDSVRGEIVAELSQTKARQALSDLANKLDGAIGDGATFDDVVKSNSLTIVESPALTAEGRDLAAPAEQPDPALADPALVPVAKAGFVMEQGDDPQVIQVIPDQRIALVTVAEVIPAGPPPLAQVRPLVERAYLLAEGAAQARKLAETLRTKIDQGQPIRQAVAGAGTALPAVSEVSAQRADISQGGKQVPAHMVALFSMKKGKTELITLQGDQGYLILHLDEIIPGDAANNPQLLAATGSGLSNVLGDEYGRQFLRAIQADVGVERNAAAIARIESEMRKANGQAQ
jgi:peptidyl-prolyl cis-trans isomerase D